MSETEVTLNNVRGGYLTLFNPKAGTFGGDPKYSMELLISKADKKAREDINAAIKAAAAGKWGNSLPKHLKIPLRDGDIPGENGMGKKSAEPGSEPYGGHFFMTVANTRKPGLVDQNLNDIIEEGKIKSGDYFNVVVNFFAFDTSGNKGVSASLQCVQFAKEGEALVSQVNPEDKFKPIAPSEASEEDVDFLGDLGQ